MARPMSITRREVGNICRREMTASPGASIPAPQNTNSSSAQPSLRKHPRIPTKLRAVLYCRETFHPVVIRDISSGGAGLDSCPSLIENDHVTLGLLSGRRIEARVRWWLGGVCGVQFQEQLRADDVLINGK